MENRDYRGAFRFVFDSSSHYDLYYLFSELLFDIPVFTYPQIFMILPLLPVFPDHIHNP